MNLMAIETLDVTDSTKSRFFRFPPTEIIDLIFIGANALPRLAVLIQPENKNTDDRNVENHSMRLGEHLGDKRIEIADVIRQTQPHYERSHAHEHKRRSK